jgi:hypothetical protein
MELDDSSISRWTTKGASNASIRIKLKSLPSNHNLPNTQCIALQDHQIGMAAFANPATVL